MSRNILSLVAIVAAAGALAQAVFAESWTAQPLTVHEWGVHVFDWSKKTPAKPDLPAFIHTDVRPGLPVPAPVKRVKDLPPDSGIRFKPVLYFYPPESAIGESVVGVEMRFAYGHANAWFPQANIYRTPDMTRDAKEPDWEAWRKANAPRSLTGNQQKPAPLVPDDPRMELVWSRLALSNVLPADAKLPDVPADHWISTARQVKSAYVSNGGEAEKFLFYEGATREKPAFAIIPESDGFFGKEGNQLHVVNVTDMPIYNVFAIYRQDRRSWVGYSPMLDPIKTAGGQFGGAGATISALTLPDFEKLTEWTDDRSFPALTTTRLLAALTEGGSLSINRSLRDPADPQGPTQSWTLFPDEAQALEKIWHDEFFNNEGLTILYRESPAALDKAMPLNLYTDKYHYIRLSRCGLVVNKGINIKEAAAMFQRVQFLQANAPRVSREQTVQELKDNFLLAETSVAYLERSGADPKGVARVREFIEEARK